MLPSLTTDADRHCPYSTRRLLHLIDVIADVKSMTYRSMGFENDWDHERVYSLDIIAALTCRLLSHPAQSWFELPHLVDHYKKIISDRLLPKLGRLHHEGTKAQIEGKLWPREVLIQLGLVDEKLGKLMNVYKIECFDTLREDEDTFHYNASPEAMPLFKDYRD